ncbi:Gfo/Idh/MocA family protein [Bradyrhizobium japonicum]|uniref:Gfo/Idh/MocA family protein n=1 Tax=Bradyrhizobium japonicum TaxID=375 RepID=UPI00190F9C46|nr:Gfo/Idh/MocA family oxidoreductase [Bradyrhizobium japonicum]
MRFPAILRANEAGEGDQNGPLPEGQRVGFAVVAMGRLSVEQILPAFAHSRKAKLAALVSGFPEKLHVLGRQYGLGADRLFGYEAFEKLASVDDVRVVYIVLPNSMHKEFVLRSAAIGKHVLCEKPMATNSQDAGTMITACKSENLKLMIAYRCRYQPHHRELIRRVQSHEFGPVKLVEAVNAQNQGDPNQWRLRKALSGGGSLPDIGLYGLNAARATLGEEPVEIQAQLSSTPNDPRFREVEESVVWTMRFPSGALAALSTSYGTHRGSRMAVHMDEASLILDHAFPYHGQRLSLVRARDGLETETIIDVPANDQFALEIDHMADCVLNDRAPDTPGEEGLRDMQLMADVYQAAQSGTRLQL